MPKAFSFFCSSIGRKVLMSFSGMLLALFLVAHVAGNLVILASHQKYNEYSHALTSNLLLLYTAEAGLIGLALLHIWMAISVTRRNRAARPQPYVVKADTKRSKRWWGSSNMGITGTLILAFIVYHLIHFKFGEHYVTTQSGQEVRDLARLVVEEFKEPFEVALYVIAMIVIGMHLLHGFRSIFDTLGLTTSRCEKKAIAIARLYVILVFGGFILIPLWIFFSGVSS